VIVAKPGTKKFQLLKNQFPILILDKLIDCLLEFDPSYLRIFNLRHPIICSRVADRLLHSKYAAYLQNQEALEALLGLRNDPPEERFKLVD